MKKKIFTSLLLSSVLLLSACSTKSSTETTTTDTTAPATTTAASDDTTGMFTDRDLEIGYNEETSSTITFSNTSASCDSDAVEISGSNITITDEGTYILTGTLDDGMITVRAEETDKIQLVLDNANITCSTSAPLYILTADKVFITTAADTENHLSNGGEYIAIDDNNIDAVIFSKEDLTLNGAGTLTLNAPVGHGIVSKDDLVLTSGTYNITSASHGLSGKNSIRIANGTFNINATKDGLHAENADDPSLGFVYLENGTFNLTAAGDGISAGSYLQIEDGEYQIEAGGGSENAAPHNTQEFSRPDEAQTAATETDENTTSTKGLKSTTDLTIASGTFAINSADDSLHSNGNISINGGTFELHTGDDGMHADSALTISDGTINIPQCYEGLEGLSIDINGGNITLVASDDGLNAAGGNDNSGFAGPGGDNFASTEGAYLNITGGTLSVNASGDGLDSNGTLTISGGETYVSGPTNDGNGSLDYDGEASITGGILIATGASGMAQNFGTASTQGVMMVNVSSCPAGSTVTLSDSNGKELISRQAEKEYSNVIVSCPEITQGSTYTLTTNDSATSITMDTLVYGEGGGMGGAPGGGGPGGGGMGMQPPQ
ncbi:major membrane immunogen (membrane-anchored lipoprotein) [Aequitasia blattaphilus]|uniref:Carbohydrate-binding domain-containing protein n=1 Tax=Aequitasia blattaphilus TaxID=2949332 RepID=A0ABT1E873_9FIRM|nr:carbohydrate-binding domain-containing protein [Aequitasia blattaphilus]MCP1102023.1 carbohydrate-binding domain-containing protein [Aequitasia blattaphilus]MCR8614663.1 carbohydrate-binding domain-containing protein [Aequitasia blattaphilus]